MFFFNQCFFLIDEIQLLSCQLIFKGMKGDLKPLGMRYSVLVKLYFKSRWVFKSFQLWFENFKDCVLVSNQNFSSFKDELSHDKESIIER